MITVVNKLTGEVYELEDKSPEQVRDAWLMLSETIKACERAKDKLKPKVEALVGAGAGEVGNYAFKVIPVQRMNYDKSVMREVLDEDTFDLFLVPDKTALDKYLKENLADLGEASTVLRQSMIAQGNPYQIIKLEKLS